MELELSYWDCLALLNIESEDEARDFDGLCIQPDGITLIVESYRDVLSPGEIANLLRQYPNAERGEPVLTFPVAWPRFKRFIETWSLVGCVDAIKAVDWVLERLQPRADQEVRPDGGLTAMRADKESNLYATIGLLTLAVMQRGPKFCRTTQGREVPNVSAVAGALEGLAKARGIDLGGLSPKSLRSHLADGQAELGAELRQA